MTKRIVLASIIFFSGMISGYAQNADRTFLVNLMERYLTVLSMHDTAGIPLAIDEEMGLVFAFSIFVHDGEPRVMKITGVPGITERPNNYGPFDLPAAHIFKIRKGMIYEMEAIGYLAVHGTKNGWE